MLSVFMPGTRAEYLCFPWSMKWFIVRMIQLLCILVGKVNVLVLDVVAAESEVLFMYLKQE